jgi:hypothetical protein
MVQCRSLRSGLFVACDASGGARFYRCIGSNFLVCSSLHFTELGSFHARGGFGVTLFVVITNRRQDLTINGTTAPDSTSSTSSILNDSCCRLEAKTGAHYWCSGVCSSDVKVGSVET